MQIKITSQRDTDLDESDLLLPYVARADFHDIYARDFTPERAEAGARQICLSTLAHFASPPTSIKFTIKRIPDGATLPARQEPPGAEPGSGGATKQPRQR